MRTGGLTLLWLLLLLLLSCRLPGEKANPYNWNQNFKWVYTITCALVTLCIAFASSCYSGAAPFLVKEFEVSEEVIILGISLYVSIPLLCSEWYHSVLIDPLSPFRSLDSALGL